MSHADRPAPALPGTGRPSATADASSALSEPGSPLTGPHTQWGRPERTALLGSLLLVLTGVRWRLRPESYPFGPDDRYHDMSLISGVAASDAVLTVVGLGVVGTSLLCVLALVPAAGGSRVLLTTLAVHGGLMSAVFGFVLPDIQLLILLAYATTLALPALVAFVVARRIVSGRADRFRPRRVAAGVVPRVAAAAVLVATLVALVLAKPASWGGEEASTASAQRPLVLVLSVALGLSWAAVAVRALRSLRARCLRCGFPGAGWSSPERAARWGRVVTWAAALTPMPYVVQRLSWLTPWPYGETSDHLAREPGLWLFGLGLAAAGELGTWLTLGLIRERGEVAPSWVPGLGGKRVNVLAAVFPGAAVALLMSVGGHSIVQQAFGPGAGLEDRLLVLLVPLPVWGPLLAAAVLAYWFRRRGDFCRHPASPGPAVEAGPS